MFALGSQLIADWNYLCMVRKVLVPKYPHTQYVPGWYCSQPQRYCEMLKQISQGQHLSRWSTAWSSLCLLFTWGVGAAQPPPLPPCALGLHPSFSSNLSCWVCFCFQLLLGRLIQVVQFQLGSSTCKLQTLYNGKGISRRNPCVLCVPVQTYIPSCVFK